ncbi:MAG: DNA primase [Alphaproteobacteria bacterium]|nr:DNA primase [Alphaproteobacteria bacterium]
MSFPPRFLEELRSRLSITEVVGRKVKLTRKGREQWGCCPFHNEKTPSFSVSDEKGFYHCFGCGAHGDVIGFTMRAGGLPFPEAVERLAGEAGMEVPKASPEEREQAKREASLYEVMELACRHFEAHLRSPQGREALAYLKGRGLTDETIARFRLGFAPEDRNELKVALLGETITKEMLIEAGLLIQPEDGGREPYGRFRGRVMFPITDKRGRVVAFGGRIMGAGEPKYLNSPETPLFHKGRQLYALAQAREGARATGRLIAVEGYMDVIALHQAGLDQAVAPLGTALTEAQIEEMWRLAPEPILCFDGDGAGQRAAGRALERALPLLKPGLSLRFATLPEGEDPDTLVAKQGAQGMEAILGGAQSLLERLWITETQSHPIDTPERRAALEKRLEEQTRQIQDQQVQYHYRGDIRARLRNLFFPPRPPRGKSFKGKDNFSQFPPRSSPLAQPSAPEPKLERLLLACLISHPDLIDEAAEALGHLTFSDPALDRLRQEVLNLLAQSPGLDSDALRHHLEAHGCKEAVDSLLRTTLARFAKAGAGRDEAKKGMLHALGRLRRPEIVQAIVEAERRLGEQASDETWEALKTLQDELNTIDHVDDDEDV